MQGIDITELIRDTVRETLKQESQERASFAAVEEAQRRYTDAYRAVLKAMQDQDAARDLLANFVNTLVYLRRVRGDDKV